MSIVRLFLDTPLVSECEIPLEREQAHYLFNVMRLGAGDTIHVFNGQDGEWETTVLEAGKKRGLLKAVSQRRPRTAGHRVDLRPDQESPYRLYRRKSLRVGLPPRVAGLYPPHQFGTTQPAKAFRSYGRGR